MARKRNDPAFPNGTVVRVDGGEIKIDEYLGIRSGRSTYRVILDRVVTINSVPCNVFLAQVVPTLRMTGVCPIKDLGKESTS